MLSFAFGLLGLCIFVVPICLIVWAAFLKGSLLSFWHDMCLYPWFSIPFGIFILMMAFIGARNDLKKKAAKEAAEAEIAAKECGPQPSK